MGSFAARLQQNLNDLVNFCRWRPYRVECTGSLSTSEVKRHRARLVLGWGTAWELPGVLPAFTCSPSITPIPRDAIGDCSLPATCGRSQTALGKAHQSTLYGGRLQLGSDTHNKTQREAREREREAASSRKRAKDWPAILTFLHSQVELLHPCGRGNSAISDA